MYKERVAETDLDITRGHYFEAHHHRAYVVRHFCFLSNGQLEVGVLFGAVHRYPLEHQRTILAEVAGVRRPYVVHVGEHVVLEPVL